MVKEKDSDDQIERSGLEAGRLDRAFDVAEVSLPGASRILARLADGRGRQVHAHDLCNVRRQQQLRIADAAAQAEHARFLRGACCLQNA